jgi:hypothetical protein
MRAIRRLASRAGAAMLGLTALAGTASAETFTYSSYSVVNEVNVTIGGSGPPGFEDGYFGSGQIDLIGSGADLGLTLSVWCIDATHILQSSDTYGFVTPPFTDNGGTGGPGTQISNPPVLGEIGALVNWGDANINSNYNVSAAVQLAIWTIEYPDGTFTSDSSAVNMLVATLVNDVQTDATGFAPYTNLFEVVDPKDNQGLVFATGGYNTQFVNPTPLPSTWTMMLIGLAGLGFIAGQRRKRFARPA